jgi:UDPglucose--hexose-1-phosphate uridylyltransferase
MELRRERFEAEILDPRNGFAATRIPLEIRTDPLTGQTSRILPRGTFQPPAQLDLAELAEQSRTSCPFCAERVETQTPRFTPDVVAEGRIRRGEALLFPNLAAYAKWSAVSIYSPDRHFLPLEELTAPLIGDNLATQLAFARAALAADASSCWISINANHLPPSGSSIFHPHLQGSANPVPTTMQRLLAGVDPHRFREYVEMERDGERHLGSTGTIDWIASFAPIGPAELCAFLFEEPSPERLADDFVGELAQGLELAFGLYAELGFQSFNLAVHGAPDADGGFPTSVRVVARSYYGPLLRSDAMWSERLQWEAAVDVAPETVAELGRRYFGSGSSL